MRINDAHADAGRLSSGRITWTSAYAVCDLLTSGYGTDYWNRTCSPERLPVTLTVIIKNSKSEHPEVQFFPAMRFNPTKSVQLFIYAPRVSKQDAKNWVMNYCPDKGKCIDESVADRDLTTYIDYSNNVLFRRVKHFSGYVVAENSDDGLQSASPAVVGSPAGTRERASWFSFAPLRCVRARLCVFQIALFE